MITSNRNYILLVLILFVATIYGCTSNAGQSQPNQATDSSQQNNSEYEAVELKNIQAYTTAKNENQKLAKSTGFLIGEFNQPDEHFPTLIIDAKRRFQTIEGFGGALTDAAAESAVKRIRTPQDKAKAAQKLGYERLEEMDRALQKQ